MARFFKSCITVALFALVFSCGSSPPSEGLALTGGSAALTTPRELMALARLADGRVLAVGGFNGAFTLASCELYEPSTGLWAPTGSLRTPRRNHAAVALADGRVLVVGGTSSRAIGALASAEVYEPATGRWTPVASMGAARNDPAAVLLADGRALFVSGLQAELYAPATGRWARAGALGGAAGTHRYGHSVTRLPDGRVLVVGGNTTRASTTAEVFEPATDTWTLVASPSLPRELHGAAVTAEGAVLVVGGYYYTSGALAGVERFEPATGRWSVVAPLREARRGAGVVGWGGGAPPPRTGAVMAARTSRSRRTERQGKV